MKKIIAVILTLSFLAVTPAQAAGPDRPDRPAQAASPDRPAQAVGPDRNVFSTQSNGGGIWCCLTEI